MSFFRFPKSRWDKARRIGFQRKITATILTASACVSIVAGTYALPDIEDLIPDLSFNAERIELHGTRADSIVRNMLLDSRGKPGGKVPVDINKLLSEYVNLAFHGMRGSDSDFNSDMVLDLSDDVGKFEIVQQTMGRVFLNILNNAFYAVGRRAKAESEGYSPTVTVSSRCSSGRVEIQIEDNGGGIPHDLLEKIFEPFFTTKPAGSGTTFTISLPGTPNPEPRTRNPEP